MRAPVPESLGDNVYGSCGGAVRKFRQEKQSTLSIDERIEPWRVISALNTVTFPVAKAGASVCC
jgi:CMP-2-keto-3-deoxyoctulosonic acid synthetase